MGIGGRCFYYTKYGICYCGQGGVAMGCTSIKAFMAFGLEWWDGDKPPPLET